MRKERNQMKLTNNFTLSEFAVSRDFPELAAQIKFSPLDKYKLYLMCRMLLQPIRDQYGQSLIVLSGKRSDELNAAIPGSITSDHLFRFESCAVDFTIEHIIMEDCFKLIRQEFLPCFGQLIYYPHQNFIHISLPTPKHHGEVFTK